MGDTQDDVQAHTHTKTPRKRCRNGHREVEWGHSGTTGSPMKGRKAKCEAMAALGPSGVRRRLMMTIRMKRPPKRLAPATEAFVSILF